MVELIITDRLHRKIVTSKSLPRLVSMRALRKREILIARKLRIRRYYLPSLNKAESVEFFKEFDKFWDQVIKPFGPSHPFWRNVVSSKMQEWERSAAYLALILFTIAQKAVNEPKSIVIVCSSLEEECVCEEWGKKMGWKVYGKPYFPLPCWSRRIFQEIRNLKNFLRMFAACLYKKVFSPKYKQESSPKNDKILIASLFYDSCFNNGVYLDPFFENLHKIIRQNGKSVTYIAGPLGNYRESAKKVRDCGDVSIIIPYSIIRWAELISLGLKVFIRRVRLPRTTFCGCDFSRLIMWNARRFEYFFNLDSEIYYTAMTNLCKIEHFERLIQLYEGNVFERECIQAFRKYAPVAITGYSHAVIYSLNIKIRLTEAEKSQRPAPDFFIATGPENKRLMVETGNHDEESIQTACALRNIPDLGKVCSPKSNNSTILIALDGVWSTAIVLNWFLKNVKILNEYNFIIRSHPNIPVGKLIEQCLYNVSDNFIFSVTNLKSDFEKCFCVIYRQTSVGLQALMNGIPAIHLNIDAPLSCDPIENLKIGKLVVSDIDQLLSAIEEIKSLSEESSLQAMNAAREYASKYFSEKTDENINVFLK